MAPQRPAGPDGPLLRIYDWQSGSQPRVLDGNRMLARAPQQPLRDHETRCKALRAHVNHGDWTTPTPTPTPFILFTSSPKEIESLARFREACRRRGSQTLVVVNPLPGP